MRKPVVPSEALRRGRELLIAPPCEWTRSAAPLPAVGAAPPTTTYGAIRAQAATEGLDLIQLSSVHPAASSELEWTVFLNEYAKYRNSFRSGSQDDVPLQVAAAALERIVRVRDGIWVLQDGRSGLFSGLLVRHAFECWLIGLYLCLERRAALGHLLDADARALAWLATKNPDSQWVDEATRYDGRSHQRLNFEDLADRVGTELRRRDLPPLDPRVHYDSMYRAESRGSAHAGIGTLLRHLDGDGREIWLKAEAPDGLADDVALTWTLTYGAHLAGFVLDGFGLPRGVMDNVLWQCIDLFEDADD